MSHHYQFGNCFEDLKNAAHDFGEYVRDAANEAPWREHDGPFERMWRAPGDRPFSDYFFPRVNVFTERDGSLVFEFMLAGFDESSIGLSFKDDKMILKARLPESTPERESRHYEIHRFTLRDVDYRDYPVPAERYDQGRVRAAYKNGILTVTIPRREDSPETEGVKINIQSEGS